MGQCGFCKERDNKIKNYEEDIEKEKIVKCQMALEREKIAKGMQCTKADEVRLKEMQLMQIEEKKLIEEERQRVERMWHELLLDTVELKERYERDETNRLKQEMVERRLFYDEQVASANKKMRDAIKQEKEIENRRLERMKKKMEEDYFEEIKRKKDMQQRNKINFIEGHENKLMRMRNIKKQERELDNKTISTAIEDLSREKQKMRNHIQALRIEEKVFVNNRNREKIINEKLAQDTDNVIIEWERQTEKLIEDKIKSAELQKLETKKSAKHEYRRYVEQRQREMEKEREERSERMKHVKKTAFAELRRNLDSANDEMRRQIQYRNNLTNQIRENQKILEAELNVMESIQRPFTKKANMFKEAMADKVNHSRDSTNPVHPFRRILETQSAAVNSKLTLPSISNNKL